MRSDELGTGELGWLPKVSSRMVCGFTACVMLCKEGIRREASSFAKMSLPISGIGQVGITEKE